MRCHLCPRQIYKCFNKLSILQLLRASGGRHWTQGNYAHLTDERSEAWRAELTCSKACRLTLADSRLHIVWCFSPPPQVWRQSRKEHSGLVSAFPWPCVTVFASQGGQDCGVRQRCGRRGEGYFRSAFLNTRFLCPGMLGHRNSGCSPQHHVACNSHPSENLGETGSGKP